MAHHAPTQTAHPPAGDLAAELQALRESLIAQGFHHAQLTEVLDAARRVSADPHDAYHVYLGLRDPEALAERLRAAAPMRGSTWSAIGIFVLGVLLGPPLAYAAVGNPWRSYPPVAPRWVAGVAAALLLSLLLAVLARYAHASRLGALAGLGGGLAQMALVSVPWLAVSSPHPGCTASGACTVPASVALANAAVAGLFYALPLMLLLAALASAGAYWAQRRRFEATLRRAR
jgi:hypothetical protein